MCNHIGNLLVLHCEGALSEPEHREVEEHLAQCADCREQARQIASLRTGLMDPRLFEPQKDLAWQLLPQRLAARVGRPPARKGWFPLNMGSVGWGLSLAASVLFACGLIWLANRQLPAPEQPRVAAGNEAVLNRMQSLYAKEVTARYLTECQDLLVDVVRAEQSCPESMYDVSFEVVRARTLLKQKRMLDAELSLPEVARAKVLCDELEGFLVNLSAARECETSDELQRMGRYIERERLLLRISLLQSELSEE
jgi:hypothetical protein